MKPAPHLIEQHLLPQFLDAIRKLPMVNAELGHSNTSERRADRNIDVRINLTVADKSFVLLVEIKKTVYPRDVRQAIWQLRDAIDSHDNLKDQTTDPLAFILAESISPGAKELLTEKQVGYFDSGGSLYLQASGAYIYIDKPPPKAHEKSVRSLFAGRRAQVLHALLVNPADWFGVNELAQRAQVSPATVSQVLTELERFEWLAWRGQGPGKERQLREPAALLDAWGKQVVVSRPANVRRYFVPDIKSDNLLARIGLVFDSHEVDYAVSNEAAAQSYAPFLSSVSQVRIRMQTGSNANAALVELGARAVTEGANLFIIDVKSSGDLLFRERVDDIWLVSPVQVYLDLLRGEGRSKEMAEHLRKERIGF